MMRLASSSVWLVTLLLATAESQTLTATIHRDELGIGHVYGATDQDTACGLGELMARDKPLQTMWALTAAMGKM